MGRASVGILQGKKTKGVGMEPGREMDALVAEAMGWKWLEFDDCGRGVVKRLYPPGCPEMGWAKDAQEETPRARGWDWSTGLYALPQFSTNDSHAMQAFSWMAERGIVVLSNGDGDSFDCDWVPTVPSGRYKMALVRAMNGYDCLS